MTGPLRLLRELAERIGQPGRFILVGGWNTVFGYGVFAALTYLLTDRIPHAYIAAGALSNVLAITNAFITHKFITFRTRGNYLREYLGFWAVYGLSALIGLALLIPTVWLVGLFLPDRRYAPYVAQGLLMPIGIVISFLGHKHISFRPSKASKAGTTKDAAGGGAHP